MSLNVRFTIRSQTCQTRLDGFQLGLCTDVTVYVSRHSKTQDRRDCSCFQCFSLQFLYNFSQHSVSAESWSWAERLPALRTAVNALLIVLIPEFIKTVHTETVTTSCSYWALQKMKTDRTITRILIIRRFCHFCTLTFRSTVEKQ